MNRFLYIFFLVLSLPGYGKEITLLLIRHGETDWNLEKKVQGLTDIPLNAKGIAQAKEVAEKLARDYPGIVAIYSSDLSRAYSTASETACKLNLPVYTRSSLREIDAGSSEGMKIEDKIRLYQTQWQELKERYPDKRERWKHSSVPGEETIAALMERMKREIDRISQDTPDKKTVAIFSHKKSIQAFLADLQDKDMDAIDIPNCGIVEAVYRTP